MSEPTSYKVFACDLCGSDDAAEIDIVSQYSGGYPMHVCRNCGFVYIRERRTAAAIADEWSDNIYGDVYTARRPAITARHTYVAGFIDNAVGLKGRSVCDIGAGEGFFLDMIRNDPYGADVFGIEPSQENYRVTSAMGIKTFKGTIEDYLASPDSDRRRFDIVCIMWTLENCQSCLRMLDAAYDLLVDGGHLVVATGSRILVPFKKPLHYYIGPLQAADAHAFRFSSNTLGGAFSLSGFEVAEVNRYIDSDYLCMIGRKMVPKPSNEWVKDDYQAVIDFFNRWHTETAEHYADA